MDRAAPVRVEELLAHREWVDGFARALVRDANDADDLAQDAWTSALRSPPRPGTSVRAWFATVLRNRLRDRARHRAVADESLPLVARREETEDSPASLLERAEIERRVIECVLALDEPFRDAVLLRFWRGMTPAEIARLRGVPAATVRTRLHRALAEVRRRLDAGETARPWRAVLLVASRDGGPSPSAVVGGVVTAGKGKSLAIAAGAALAVAGAWTWLGSGTTSPVEVGAAPTTPESSLATGGATGAARRSERAAPPGAVTDAPPPTTPAAPPAGGDAPRGTVRTRVLGPDGAPVADAEVALLLPDHGKAPEDGAPPPAAVAPRRTGADGAASLPWTRDPGPGRVVARSGKLAGISRSLDLPADETVEVRLEPTVVIAGRVLDEEDRPIPGARLSLEADLGGGMESFTRAVSGEDGTFEFLPLPESLHGEATTIGAVADGFAWAWVLVRQAGREDGPLVIRLAKGMVVSGRVVDESGSPLADVDVEVSTGDTAWTRRDGRFVTGPLRAETTRLGFFTEEHAAVAVEIADASPGARDVGDVVLRPGRPVRGLVVRRDGTPAPRVWVGIEDLAAHQFVRQGMTDAEGRFAFEHLGPGRLRVSARDSQDGPFAGAKAEIEGALAGVPEVRLTLSAGRSVQVSVVDAATGEPVKTDYVVVAVKPEGSDEGAATTMFDVRDGATSVRVDTSRDGAHVVTVRVRGYEDFGPERVVVDDEGTAHVTARLVRKK